MSPHPSALALAAVGHGRPRPDRLRLRLALHGQPSSGIGHDVGQRPGDRRRGPGRQAPGEDQGRGHHHHRHRRRPTQPNEFLDADGKTVIGMDVDLFNAVMAKFGIKTDWVPAAFDSIILGVRAASTTSASPASPSTPTARSRSTMVSYFNGRHPVGHPEGQPQEGRPRRRLRPERRRAEGHRAGRRRPARQRQGVHRRGQAGDQACSSTPTRPRSPRPCSPARPTPCSPTSRRPSLRRDSRPTARSSCSASITTRPPTATCCPRTETDFGAGHRRGPQAAQGRRHLQADPRQVGAPRAAPSPTSPSTRRSADAMTAAARRTGRAPSTPGRSGTPDAGWPWSSSRLVAMMISSFVDQRRSGTGPSRSRSCSRSPVIEGLWKGTILGTVGAMVLGIGLGIILAVMRLSTNPVLRGVAFVYIWFFRAIPRYVLLVLLGSGIGFLYPDLRHRRAVRPADRQPARPRHDLTFFTLDYNASRPRIWVGILGLGLSEAAYMAEIARAGILSVDKGQAEAAQALGMPPRQDDAPRSCCPRPCGSSSRRPATRRSPWSRTPRCSSRCRSSSSCSTRPASSARARFQIMPGLVAATLWYLIVCSILMVGQSLPREATTAAVSARRAEEGPAEAHRDGGGPLMSAADRHSDHRRRPARPRGQRHQGLPRHRGAQGHRHGRAARRGRLPARAVRLGQDHLPALHQPARDDRRRPDLGRRRPDGLRGPQRHAAPPHRQADRRPAPRHRHGASSGSTCSRTRRRSRTSSRRRSRSRA